MAINQYQEDIFADWKQQRFIVVDREIAHDNDTAYMVVLTDIKFWCDHEAALDAWCVDHPGAYQMGMTVAFDTRDLLLLFTLRWL